MADESLCTGSGMIASDSIPIKKIRSDCCRTLSCINVSPRTDATISEAAKFLILASRRPLMRAHPIMSCPVFTARPDTTMVEAANLMLQKHVSRLPVVDADGKLVGMLSEGDFV